MTQAPYYPAGPQAPYPGQPAVQTQPPAQIPAQPQYPGYPQQQAAPQPYAAPPAQYPQPYQPQQTTPQPLAQAGSLDDFYNQPSSGGGPSLKFEQIGTRYIGVVARQLGPGDVQQQTDTFGRPQTFRDGRPKWVLKVPLQMQPSPQYPDGLAQWYVKGGVRDELSRAMAEAGSTAQAPEPGATVDITFVSTRQSGAGMNPAKVFRVVYTPPGANGGAPAAAPAQPVQEQVQQPVQQQVQAPPAPPAPAQPQAPVQPQIPQQAQQPVQQPAAPQAQQPVGAAPGLTPEQQQLFAQLTGQQQQG